MTLESEIMEVLNRYGIARVTISLMDERRISVQGALRTPEEILRRRREYYSRNRERIREYQHEYYLRTRRSIDALGRKAEFKPMEDNDKMTIETMDPVKTVQEPVSDNCDSISLSGPEIASPVINHQQLASAIVYALSLKGMEISMDDAMSTSLQILSFFGYENQVLGNSLDQEDLALMYQLEDLDLVKSQVEYDYVAGGKEWRINYFLLNKKKIRDYASRERENETGKSEFSSVYDNLPEEAWAR